MTVVTTGQGRPEVGGIRVLGAYNPVYDHTNVLSWALSMGREVERQVATLYHEMGIIGPILVINWEFSQAAISLSQAFGHRVFFVPYSFEVQRVGLRSHLSIAIDAMEKYAVSQSSAIVIFDPFLEALCLTMGAKQESLIMADPSSTLTDPAWGENALSAVLGHA